MFRDDEGSDRRASVAELVDDKERFEECLDVGRSGWFEEDAEDEVEVEDGG